MTLCSPRPHLTTASGLERRRWGFIGATSPSAAERFAHRMGISPVLILSRDEVLRAPREVRHMVREAALDGVVVHSTDWRRQRSPQLYELALALTPVDKRAIVDEASDTWHWLGRGAIAMRLAVIPVQFAQAGGEIATESMRFAFGARPRPVSANGSPAQSVLAIWPGSSEPVGGAVSHITGILAAFGRAGLRVGLVTAFEPPDQVRAVADDVEICRYLTRSARMTGDTTEIISNGPVRTAAIALARRLKPSFIYQRHCGFLFAGVELSRRFRIPLVLEWNGSEDWIRKNWTNRFAVERMLDPLAESTERAAVTGAALVTAVSEEAVGMAERSGAARDRVIVLPNAVDLGYVDRTVRGTRPVVNTSGPVVGWAGSFGSWHGGEVMVRAMSLLPADVRLLMVGDGPERQACQALAARLGVAERIEWTGAMPNPDTLRRLAACDVLTSPQTPLVNQPYFQSPIKLFEYMALGRPIVASRLGQMAELLTDGRTARLVTPGDAQELAAAILAVLRSPDRGQAMADAARREVEEMHTWDHRAQTVLLHLGIRSRRDPDVRTN